MVAMSQLQAIFLHHISLCSSALKLVYVYFLQITDLLAAAVLICSCCLWRFVFLYSRGNRFKYSGTMSTAMGVESLSFMAKSGAVVAGIGYGISILIINHHNGLHDQVHAV